jgi:hypothetical protein
MYKMVLKKCVLVVLGTNLFFAIATASTARLLLEKLYQY